jgi:hypothetical protein
VGDVEDDTLLLDGEEVVFEVDTELVVVGTFVDGSFVKGSLCND